MLIFIFSKVFFKLVPILIGIISGFVAGTISDVFFNTNLIQWDKFSVITLNPATWFNEIWKFDGTFFSLPVFELESILYIAPIALVTFMEHIGDITTNGSVVGKDFMKDPGLHRTVLGDGLATALAGLIGAPANTTYSENTGVLAVTKVYDPSLLRLAAVFAIFLGIFKPFGILLQIIPLPVLGGVSILLFGMISSIGIRTLSEANLDFAESRNLIVVALILVIGLGLQDGIEITNISLFNAVIPSLKISGLFIAVVVGAVVNKILPKES